MACGVATIHPIRSTLDKSICYIIDPKKTQNETLVYGFGCIPQNAAQTFENTALLAEYIQGAKKDLSETGRKDVLAYHMIQSFDKDDAVIPEQVLQMGKEWAEEVLGEKYEYVLAVHTNTDHLHCHIIFNATSMVDYKKFVSAKNKIITFIRQKNDLIRERHGLENQQTPEKSRRKNPHQYQSFRSQLRGIINSCIRKASDYEEFLLLLQQEKVEIKEGKYLSFRISGQQRFSRDTSLGSAFSKEAIQRRIAKRHVYRLRVQYVARSTKYANTQALANTLITMRKEDISRFPDFEKQIKKLSKRVGMTKENISELSRERQIQKSRIPVLEAFHQLRPIAEESERKSGLSKAFYEREHRAELTAFSAAKAKMQQLSITEDTQTDDYKAVIERLSDDISQQEENLAAYDARLDALRQAQYVVEQIQNGERIVVPPQAQSKQKSKEQTQNQRSTQQKRRDFSL